MLVAGGAAVAAAGILQLLLVALLPIAFLVASEHDGRPETVGALLGAVSGLGIGLGDAGSSRVVGGLVFIAVVCVAATTYRRAPNPRRAPAAAWLAISVALAVGGYVTAALRARSNVDSGMRHIELGLERARAGDSTGARTELDAAVTRLSAAARALDRPWAKPVRLVPIAGSNAHAVEVLVRSMSSLAEATLQSTQRVDIGSIAISGGQIDLRVAGQVDVAATEVLASLDRSRSAAAKVHSPWLASPIERRRHDLIARLDQVRPAIDKVREAARIAPVLLADGTTKRYLVLFTTPVEARASGFPGNFAELRVEDGRVAIARFGRVGRDLQREGVPLAQRTISGPPDYLARYERFGVAQTWQNITMSPDFPSVAAAAAELYPQSGGVAVDGVMAVDPTALAALLRLTGPVRVSGIDEPIDGANAVEFLQLRQYVELGNDRRIDVLEAVALATFERLTSGSLPPVGSFAEHLAPLVRQGHLKFVAFDAEAARALRRARVDGALAPVEGDNLAVVVNNAGGNKIDAFLHRTSNYDVEWDSRSGELRGALRVTLTNRAPAVGLPDYVIGNALNEFQSGAPAPPRGTNRLWLSIYTPFWPENATVNERPANVQIERELDRWVVSLLVDIATGESVTFAIEWHGRLLSEGVYLLDLAHQPQATVEQVHIRVHSTRREMLKASRGVAKGPSVVWAGSADEPLRLVVKAG